ncbi:hypothetical protein D3C78_1382410 [compost metagenome]
MTAEKISMVAQRFLQAELPMLGIVPDDPSVTRAVKQQVPFTAAFPASAASLAIERIAKQFLELPQSSRAAEGVKGFLQKMFRLSR